MENNTAAAEKATPTNGDRWLTSDEAAEMLGVTPHTLRSYRSPSLRRGPRHFKDGRGRVRYLLSDIQAYTAFVPVEG
jgi:hypothetical protein